jgi:hypothetical protein
MTSCGTSHPERVALVPARGRVLFDGKPAAGVVLRFYPDPARSDALTPVAQTKEDGTYDVTTYETGDGGPPGRYKVALRWPVEESKVATAAKPDRLNNRYGNAEKTTWRVEISQVNTTLDDIDIPSDNEAESRPEKSSVKRSSSKSHDGPRGRTQQKGATSGQR